MESALILVELTKIRTLLTAFVMLTAIMLVALIAVAAVYLVRRYDKWLDAELDSIDQSSNNTAH
ncbi:MAG: hypothetical protein J6M06_03005 [Synergistaceae bacterium]|nr:hypothetical protein [Synergistaceae bacterium]